MAETAERIVLRSLKNSEEVKIAIEATALSDQEASTPGGYHEPLQEFPTSTPLDDVKKRVVAIVTHIDSYTGDEQGWKTDIPSSAFVLRPKTRRSATTEELYQIDHVFPIVEGFAVGMAQSRRNTLNLSASQAISQPRMDLTLTIHPGHDPLLEPVYLVTHDFQKLRTLLAECKRLKDTAVSNNEPGIIPPYPWITPYVTKSELGFLSTVPADLRHSHRPPHTLLSEAYAGSPGDDILDISVIREEWIKSKVTEVYNSSPHATTLKLRIGTFNVNGKLPSQDLSGWVRRFLDRKKYIPSLLALSPLSVGEVVKGTLQDAHVPELNISDPESEVAKAVPSTLLASSPSVTSLVPDNLEDDPDLIVLGFQELDLSAGALLYSTETTREDAWFSAVMAGLGEKAETYTKLASKQLVGMLLIAIVKTDIKARFTQIRTTAIGAGILGLMGNKGATALRLTYTPPALAPAPSPRPAVLTFVNAHLAAFDEMYDKRNQDFHDLSRRLIFDSGIPERDASSYSSSSETEYPAPTVPLNVFQSDALFWFGDLNYRLNIPDSDVRTLLSEGAEDSIPLLLQYDQLTTASRTQKAFAHFVEPPVPHLPSYRFNIASGTATDSLGYDLKRKPAWTDRILHMSSFAACVHQKAYGSHPEISMSDHKPVSAEFEIRMPTVDSEELETMVHTLWKDVSGLEDSDQVPNLKVNTSIIDFGRIGYKAPQSKVTRVSNAGQTPCAFKFVPLGRGDTLHPDWLRIEPLTGFLRPGEHIDIAFSVEVDDFSASRLNLGDGRLEVTLILHTALGKDHFLTVTGKYERTCFATSLTRLVRMPVPARKLDNHELLSENNAASAPKEILRLINWLMTEATSIDALFISPGDQETVIQIRESLDNGTSFPTPPADKQEAFCLGVAQALLDLLASLPEPVIPSSMHAACTQVSTRDEAFELMNELPSASVNVWISITSFLHFISQQGAIEKKVEKLAAIFAPILLRDSFDMVPTSPISKRRFTLFFIA